MDHALGVSACKLAKAAGLPIVANRTGGVGEILDAKDMSEFTVEKMVEKTAALY